MFALKNKANQAPSKRHKPASARACVFGMPRLDLTSAFANVVFSVPHASTSVIRDHEASAVRDADAHLAGRERRET